MNINIRSKHIHSISFFAAILLMLFTSPLYAESIFLKDGSIIEGKVQSDSGNEITILMQNQLKITIPKDRVLRRLETNEYKRLVEIKKSNGSSITGYIVDQDSDKIKLRMNLSSSSETELNKKDILSVLSAGEPVSIDSIAAKKETLKPRQAALNSINPLRSGSFLAESNAWGVAFCFIKTGALVLPLSIMIGSAFGSPNSGDSMSNDSSSNSNYLDDPKTKNLVLGSLAVWVLATAGDMIYSYNYVKNYNEKQQNASLESGAVRFSVLPKISFPDNMYNRKASCDGLYVSISSSF